jgi:hypothetical protein
MLGLCQQEAWEGKRKELWALPCLAISSLLPRSRGIWTPQAHCALWPRGDLQLTLCLVSGAHIPRFKEPCATTPSRIEGWDRYTTPPIPQRRRDEIRAVRSMKSSSQHHLSHLPVSTPIVVLIVTQLSLNAVPIVFLTPLLKLTI